MSESEPSMTYRKELSVVKTRVVLHLWDQLAGRLITVRVATGI
jgi:hypothetical protein